MQNVPASLVDEGVRLQPRLMGRGRGVGGHGEEGGDDRLQVDVLARILTLRHLLVVPALSRPAHAQPMPALPPPPPIDRLPRPAEHHGPSEDAGPCRRVTPPSSSAGQTGGKELRHSRDIQLRVPEWTADGRRWRDVHSLLRQARQGERGTYMADVCVLKMSAAPRSAVCQCRVCGFRSEGAESGCAVLERPPPPEPPFPCSPSLT